MDETLIHCNDDPNEPCDIQLDIEVNEEESIKASINIRPYAIEILKRLS
jgi:CTD small phosphatase-like protein 2